MPNLCRLLALACLLLTAGCASAPSKAANEIYKQGLDQAKGGNTKAAIETFQNGIKTHPSHVRMRFELAQLQYTQGEAFHLNERIAMRKAASLAERGKRKEALAARRKGTELNASATPYYEAARNNLLIVVDDEEEDERIAWGYYLLMRCSVFFQRWEDGYEEIEQAIVIGRPAGALLAQWREFQSLLRERLGPDDS